MTPTPAGFSVSSFNVHWGGRLPHGRTTYDLAAACRTFDTDVRVFQEDWVCPEEPSRLWAPEGFTFHRLTMAEWRRPERFELASPEAERVGGFGLAVATRFDVLDERVLQLPHLERDPRCLALALHLATPIGAVWLVALHYTIAFVPLGAAVQARALGRLVPGDGPAVIVGDHNLWGPPARLLYGWRTWRPAVKGKTWHTPRPRHQIDHVWTRGLRATAGRVLPDLGSDHLPITANMIPA